MGTCKDCKFFDTDSCGEFRKPFGRCTRWNVGYEWDPKMPLNEVLVENDEGWGMVVGPDFGCVLWAAK